MADTVRELVLDLLEELEDNHDCEVAALFRARAYLVLGDTLLGED